MAEDNDAMRDFTRTLFGRETLEDGPTTGEGNRVPSEGTNPSLDGAQDLAAFTRRLFGRADH